MASAERATILIVEDDLGLARLECARLERAGHAVETARSAEEGMERVRRGGVDLLILDQRLPSGVSGLQLYERIKAAGFDVPAILATGFSDEATLLQALRVGVRDFVPKTTDYLNYLVPAVARVLKEVRTERELAESRVRAREMLQRQRELEAEIAERKIAEKDARKGTRSAARSRPSQGRVPGDAGPRAAQSLGADPQRPGHARNWPRRRRRCGQTRDMMERQVSTWSGWWTICWTFRASRAARSSSQGADRPGRRSSPAPWKRPGR